MSKKQIGGGEISVIAIVLAIFLLIMLLWYYYSSYKNNQNNKKKSTWPPKGYNACPDYWVNVGNGQCVNPHGIGLPNTCYPGIKTIKSPLDSNKQVQSMEFSGELYNSSNSNAPTNKCHFSKNCQTPWEGIDTLCA